MHDVEPREVTAGFQLERVLKSSRTGVVLSARHPETGGAVVIKLIAPGGGDRDAARTRFLHAMSVLEAVRPASFPAILDYGFTPDGSAFIVMDPVVGQPVSELPAAQPARTLPLLIRVIEDLEGLHALGVAHGNLSPENLLLHGSNDIEYLMVLGCGTAAYRSWHESSVVLAPDDPQLACVAPELLAAGTEPDWPSDAYSLARLTAELVGAKVGTDASGKVTVELPEDASVRLAQPGTLVAVVRSGLDRNPLARSALPAVFREAFHVALEGTLWGGSPPGQDLSVPPSGTTGPPQPVREGGDDELGRTSVLSSQRVLDAIAVRAYQPEPPRPEPRLDATNPVAVKAAPIAPAPPGSASAPAPQPAPAGSPPPVPPQTPGPAAPPAPSPSGIAPIVQGLSAPPVPAPLPTSVNQKWTVAPPAPQPAPAKASKKLASTGATRLVGASAGIRRRTLAVAIGAVIVAAALASAAVFLWIASHVRSRAAVQPVRRPAPTVPARPTPVPFALTALRTAEEALTAGDIKAAGDALRVIAPADEVALQPGERERLEKARETHGRLRRDGLARDIVRALRAGNLRLLRESVDALGRDDEAVLSRDIDTAQALEEARRALNLYRLASQAQRDGNWAETLRNATTLQALVPRLGQAAELRVAGAAGLEAEADALAKNGQYEQALEKLATLAKQWPDRSGLSERTARVRSGQETDAKLAAILVAAEQAEQHKVPERGLDALRSASFTPRYAAQARQLQERLQRQLEELDRQPPTVDLPKNFRLEYEKNKPARIPLSVADDHAVKAVRAFARAEGASNYVELPVTRGADGGYTLEVSTQFHQNGTVELYVTVTDLSGHRGQLGSAEQPLKLRKKRWSLFG